MTSRDATTTEHDLIREICALLSNGPGVRVGPGDDCAVLVPEPGRDLLLTTDAAVEGVHFDLAWMDARAIGRRAMAANLSDVAAMGGRPRWATVALELPRCAAGETALAMVRGAAEEATRFGASIVGGNLSRATTGGGIAITITVAGDVAAGRSILRSGGRAGDELWTTGDLGGARGGLLVLAGGLTDLPGAADLVRRFAAPEPRVRAGLVLADAGGVRAMIDLSDGLSSDAGHLARESGCAAVIDVPALPLDPALTTFARAAGRDPAEIALEGGEDYELLFAAEPGRGAAISRELDARLGLRATRIGVLEQGSGVRRVDGRPIAARGFDHFAPGAQP